MECRFLLLITEAAVVIMRPSSRLQPISSPIPVLQQQPESKPCALTKAECSTVALKSFHRKPCAQYRWRNTVSPKTEAESLCLLLLAEPPNISGVSSSVLPLLAQSNLSPIQSSPALVDCVDGEERRNAGMSELAGVNDPGLRTGERRGAKKTSPAAWTEFRGVYRRRSGKYGAQIKDLAGKSNIWLGTFDTAEDAARAYDAAAVKLRGTAARTNFKQAAAIDDGGGVSSLLQVPAEPSGHSAHRQPTGEYIAQVCDSKGRAALSQGGIGSPSMRHHGLSVDVPWQQVTELLKDMDSSDDRKALIEAAAILQQISLAGHGETNQHER